MKIVVYDKHNWGKAVTDLFAAIYPEWSPKQCTRMAYDQHHSLHILTLLAVKDKLPIGQINFFRVSKSAELCNVGYHVHPDWQGKGIASELLQQALLRKQNQFSDGLVVQTNDWNTASKALASKAGFTPVEQELLTKYQQHLKFLSHDDGVCFHLPSGRLDET